MQLEVIHRAAKGAARKTPLLFVHGVCHGAWCWEEKFLPYFADNGWNSYALSLRGHAGSEGRAQLDAFGLQDYVDDVLATAEKIGAKPVIIGHSMGGGITQLLLQRAAQQVAGAVLFASMPPGFLQPGEEPAVPPSPAGMAATMQLLQGKTLSPEQVLQLPFMGGRIIPEQAARYAPLLQAESARAVDEIPKMNTPALPVPVPLFVIGSKMDSIFGEAPVLRTAAHYGVDATVLEQGCHDLMLDPDWQTSADALLHWLNANFT